MADDSDSPVESVREAAAVLRRARTRPVAEQPPVVETPPPVADTPPPVIETPPPSDDTPPPAAETVAEPPRTETPPPVAPPVAQHHSPAAHAARAVGHAAKAVWNWFADHRGVRVALLGLALILVSVYLGGGSALSLPLLVIGLVVLAVGTLGSRLRGHVNLSWGPDGSAVDIHTEVVPPRRHRAPATPPATPTGRPRLTLAQPPEPVIEGHGETIEMDVGQLQALLAAERAARGDK